MIINFFNSILISISNFFNILFSDVGFLISLGFIYLVMKLFWPKPKAPKDPLLQINDTLKSMDNNLTGINFGVNNINSSKKK